MCSSSVFKGKKLQTIGTILICLFLLPSYAEETLTLTDEDWTKVASAANAILHRLSGDPQDPPNFMGYGITATGTLEDSALISALAQAMKSEVEFTTDFWALCFVPRHAISITWDQGTTEFLICYECGRMKVYHNFEKVLSTQLHGESKKVFEQAWLGVGT